MRTRRSLRIFAAGALCALVLGACGGGGDDDGDDGVASLAGSSGEAASASGAAGDDVASEEEILAWVECMREEGLDIADPTVDADGNLQLGGGPRGGFGGRPGGTTATTGGTEQAQPFDREAFQGASDKCGEPPRTGGGFSEEDREELQDSALEFAQCLRDEGLEVADPDFSAQGPGGPPRADADAPAGDDAQPQPGGIFGGLDLEDPTTQAAFEKCQSSTGGAFPGGGRGGPPGAGGGD